ncbi:hypothetical protein [Leptolyngbya ohadii]|uniref:hypothetical protein n=1 Tax=Leptolyngbya ohadii TaxID=1962290 RepID=UPI000B59A68F|nr:hypothetical protein [Leptolyngbya ohadii]
MTSTRNGHVETIDILPTAAQVGFSPRRTGDSAISSGGDLQQVVDGAIARILGKNVNPQDSKTLVSSLNQVFVPKDSNGRTDYVWMPRTYSVQTELGGKLTGAQASLYYRAKVVLDNVLPLLNGLSPLNPAADPQNMEAVRSVVRTELVELVNELGVESGPRQWKVDSLFRLLLGSDWTGMENGQLYNLMVVFGLERDRINTVGEEEAYSNYLIILDYMRSLYQSWRAYVTDNQAEPYLGTQLVKLSQAMSVVAESVAQAFEVMDNVYLGPAERQTVIFDFSNVTYPPDNNSPTDPTPIDDSIEVIVTPRSAANRVSNQMTLQELLTWVMSFATTEGQSLARDGGRLAIAEIIEETAGLLAALVDSAAEQNVSNSAFRRAGVRDVLRDLASQLEEVRDLAAAIHPPELTDRDGD